VLSKWKRTEENQLDKSQDISIFDISSSKTEFKKASSTE